MLDTPKSNADKLAQQFGNYRLVRPLGSGGFAEVFLAEHIHLQTQAAIKVLHTRMTQEERENFRIEALTIAHLKHPHIVRVLEFGFQDDGTPYLVMEYAPNGSLRTHYKGCIPLATLMPTVKSLAEALDHAHQHKVVHRDIKPDNMLLDADGNVLLSDFGIAVVASTSSVQHTVDATGTPAYMAPEQFQGKPRPASDQYALAVTVYEWLCGKRPFDGDATALGYQHVHNTPPSLCEQNPQISRSVERVILKALAKDPHQRYESVTAFAMALELATEREELSTQDTRRQSYEEFDEEECFVCHFEKARTRGETPGTCVEKRLQGHLISAQERMVNGKLTPCITIELDTKFVVVALPIDYYRDLVHDIITRGKSVRRLPVTLYHLPAPIDVSEYKGKPLYRYIAYSTTLVVLDPDTLLNITDLSQADYCTRKYLLNRLVASSPNTASIRGNIIHTCFTSLLKQNDNSHENKRSSLEILNETFEEALAANGMEMALANVSMDMMRIDVKPHMESLANWYDGNRVNLWGSNDETQTVRTETFLLVPEIGLRGRLDIYWEQPMNQSLLELKTGGASGNIPKSDHRQQVHGYQALLTVRHNSKKQKARAQLLYSGTPGHATASELRLDERSLQHINALRNTLVLMHTTGTPPAPPARRCTRCSMLNTCDRVSSLLNWQPPQPVPPTETGSDAQSLAEPTRLPKKDNEEDRALFAYYYELLQLDGLASEEAMALLWKSKVDERVATGKTIVCKELVFYKRVNDGWEQTFSCENGSELRVGDEVLLSINNPITGEVVSGTIIGISTREVTLWTRELLESTATASDTLVIDSYANDLVHVRTLQNLLRWLDGDSQHLRDLVAGRVRPRFVDVGVVPRKDFNEEQNDAVARALQMQDYMLIQGPPGTGKTSVIAEIVKRLTQQGQRVLLAAFTNQAVDNMLKRLKREGFEDFIRLGHDRSVDAEIRDFLLKHLVEDSAVTDNEIPGARHVFDMLSALPVVASTTATWSSDKYSPGMLETESSPLLPMQFDVAIIDEASQLTVPAILGALRFAKRFILVGDDLQLPPLVQSEEAAKRGLATSLFSTLKKQEEAYTDNHMGALSACVALKTQYRMNQWISNFSSTVFYKKELVAHSSVARRQLVFSKTPPVSWQEPAAVTQSIDPRYPLVFVDVRGEHEHGMKVSTAEATMIRDLVHGLLERGLEESAIGIIAPYRAQVATIRRALFEKDEVTGWHGLSPETLLSVDTVDRFQGGERSIIIMSFATSSEPEADSPQREFLTNGNRLNVALTRAQHKLLLVGSVPALEHLPIFDRLVTYCRSMKTVISAKSTVSAIQ